MKVRPILLILLLLVVTASTSNAQAPKYGNEFLSIGVGARALSLSGAFTALANDATAGYWNPAGLTRIQSNLQLSLMHTQYFAGIARYDYGALAFRSGEHNHFALSYIRFGIDDIADTSELIDADGNINYDRIRSFSASDNAFFFSYARVFPNVENLHLGANAKVIRRKAGSFAGAWGFGLDVGLQYHWDHWHFALVARDITTTFNAWSYDFNEQMREVFTLTGNEIPTNSLEVTLPRLVLGAARQFGILEDFELLASLDIIVTTDGRRNVLVKGDPLSLDPNLGLELSYKNLVFLRAGTGNYQRYTHDDESFGGAMQWNMGLGINLGKHLSIDYCLTDVGDRSVALYSNIFSLRFNIQRRERMEPEENTF